MTLFISDLSAKISETLQSLFTIPSSHTIHNAHITYHVVLAPLPQAFQGHAVTCSLSSILLSDFLNICSKLSLTPFIETLQLCL